MKTIRANTFIHALKNGRIRHVKVTDITDQDNLEVNIGNETVFDVDRGTTGTGVTNTRGSLFRVEKSTKTNEILNPSFETNTTGWIGFNANYTVSQYTTDAKFGSNCMRVNIAAATGLAGSVMTRNSTYRIAVANGETWTASAWFKTLVGSRSYRIAIATFATAAGTTAVEVFTGNTVVNPSSFEQSIVRATFTNASSNYMEIRLFHTTTGFANDAFLVDGVIAVETNNNTYYWDGANTSLTDAFDATLAWTGTADASTSTAQGYF